MKWIIRLLGLVAAVAVVLVAAVLFLPAERLARIATDQIATATGRQVEIRGDVALSFWPVLGLTAEDLVVANADWASPEPMFSAERAAIGVDALGLLGGDIRITHVEATAPTVRLARKIDGRVNWALGAPSSADASGTPSASPSESPVETPSQSREVSIARIEISGASVLYEAEGSAPLALRDVDLTLDWPEPSGAATLVAVLSPAGTPVRLDLTVETFDRFLRGEVSPLRLGVETDKGRVALDGRGSTAGALAGAFSLSTSDTDGLLRSLGLPGAALPPKLGRSVTARSEITLTPERQLALRGMNVDLGGNAFSGDADLSFAGKPRINARLDAGDLDLAGGDSSGGASNGGGGQAGGSGGAPASSATAGWSKTPIDAGVLGAFDGEVALSARSIDLGDFRLGQTRTVLRNEDARMVFELREVAAYGGTVVGEFVVNNRSGLSVGGTLDIAAIQIQPLLSDAIDFNRLTGKGDLRLSFLGSGQSVDAIMRSLSGSGGLQIGRGTIEGIDLDRLLSGGTTGGTTIFNDLTATWTIASGVLSNRDLLLQLKNYRASGSGVVGLGTRTVDYRFTPVALRANSGQGLAIPVIFEGPWSNVSIRPDVEAAVDQRLDAEKDKLQERAREKAAEKLGIATPDGKASEDAIKDEVKNRLLRKLFD